MKKNIFYGLMLAVAFLLSGASWASPYSNELSYTSPDYEKFVLAVWPPAVPAVSGPDFMAMAITNSDDNKETTCMAACHNDKRTSVGLSYFKSKVTDNLDLGTVLACGYSDIPKDKPYKVPIAV